MCKTGSIVNRLFAPFDASSHGLPLPDANVRVGVRSDLEQTGSLAAHREGGQVSAWVARHERQFDADGNVLFVVEYAGRIVGYGWVAWLTPVAHGGRNAPDGWYLNGMVIDPALRRRGLGRQLTCERVDWVLGRDDVIHYVVAASNHASRDLHASLGFEEVSGDFRLPGVVFTHDDGLLCRLVRRAQARVIPLDSRRG